MHRCRLLLLSFCLALPALPARALDPRIPLQDLNHAAWSDRDGAPTGSTAMAQTPDGWMWLGNKDGLYRFDGVRFERFPLPDNQVNELHAMPDGDLLIANYYTGLSVLHPDGRLDALGKPAQMTTSIISALDTDAAGAIWLASANGIARYRGGRWETIDTAPHWQVDYMSLMVDQYDQVWAADGNDVYLFDRAAGKFARVPGDLHGKLTESPDGRVWVVSNREARVVPVPARANPLPRRPDFNQAESRTPAQFDRDGNLWLTGCPVGLCRIEHAGDAANTVLALTPAPAGRLDQAWQLTSTTTSQVLEDRESNVWVATPAGVDRFRTNRLVPVHLPTASMLTSFASDTEGVIWAVEDRDGTLWRIPADGPPQRDPRTVRLVTNDRDGAILFVGAHDIERVYHGVSTRIAYPKVNGKQVDLAVYGVLDDGKVLWLVALQTGAVGLVDGQWKPRSAFHLPDGVAIAVPAGRGQIWLGCNDGKLHFYDDGKITLFDIHMVGRQSGVFPGPQLVAGGEHGIAAMQNGRFDLLGAPDDEALRNVTGMTTTADGDRWLNGSKGIVHIRRDDWDAALRDPHAPLRYELIDALEGYPGRAAFDPQPTVRNAGNGRIWFRTSAGIVRLETAELRPNPVKPTVRLLALDTPARSYPAGADVRLPPDSPTFSVRYTAPGLRKPEGMRFQYRLDGLDKDWQDAGTRRAAYYTNVGPGRYVFRVRALNEDGVAGEGAAALPIAVAPTVTQSWWFQAGCAALALLAGVALYRYRLRAATVRIARQMQARIDERERIARTLHDTFLQSVHALSLQLYGEVMDQPEGSGIRARLKAILERANRTIDEGRAQVQQLRTGADAEQVLDGVGTLMADLHPPAAFALQVDGARRALAPPVQEELCEIGQEAIRNAFRHAGARTVTATLAYGADALALRVADDGRGFDPQSDRGGDGHWGLVGMRERAQRIGGQLHIASAAGAGTVVELRVAGALAYRV